MPALSPGEFKRLDALIRDGRGSLARPEIRRHSQKKLPRDSVVRLANLAWRANLPHAGLRLLHSIVRPGPRIPVTASGEEKAEYANCLTKVGAPEEALALLKELEGKVLPKAWLYEAAAHMSQWNYTAAIPLLERYSRSRGTSEYHQLVGKTNLLAALVHERMGPRALILIRELLYKTSMGKWRLLHAIVLELAAVHFIMKKQFRQARDYLGQAKFLMKDSQAIQELFVRKWGAIADVLEKPSATSLSNLRKIREEAIARNHWETLRDCDRFEVIATHNGRLFLHLYIGTPFEGFRKWLVHDFGKPVEIPERYLLHLGGTKPKARVLSLLDGDIQSQTSALKVGNLLHRLIKSLAVDFYRPSRLTTLHYRLYPDEYFNPVSSPTRIYYAIHSLRSWFKEARLPLRVEEIGGAYRLASVKPSALEVPTSTRAQTKNSAVLDRIRSRWPADDFSAAEAGEFLKKAFANIFQDWVWPIHLPLLHNLLKQGFGA